MASGDDLSDQLDQLTRYAHDLDAFCNAWILTWLAMEQAARTPEERAWCCYEVECWSKVRSRSVQAVYKDINKLLRRAGHD